MAKKTTNSRLVIQDDIQDVNYRAQYGRSRRGNKDRPTTQRTVDKPERGPMGQEEAPTSDEPSGTHCTSPSVQAERVIAPRRPTQSQGRPLGQPLEDKEAPKEPLKLCQFYMRTGTCGYGDGCRHIHPPNVYPPQLSALGYPLRKGVERCRFYIRNGFCGYGATCRFDHPMPATQRTTQRMLPNVFGPSLNGGAPFSESMYMPQMPTSSWYGPVLPPMSYAALMARHQSFTFTGGYPQFPYEYPPVPMPLPESWAHEKYVIGSPPLFLAGPTNSEETSELHEDVSKFESEDDSDTSGHVDRCWSN